MSTSIVGLCNQFFLENNLNHCKLNKVISTKAALHSWQGFYVECRKAEAREYYCSGRRRKKKKGTVLKIDVQKSKIMHLYTYLVFVDKAAGFAAPLANSRPPSRLMFPLEVSLFKLSLCIRTLVHPNLIKKTVYLPFNTKLYPTTSISWNKSDGFPNINHIDLIRIVNPQCNYTIFNFRDPNYSHRQWTNRSFHFH